MVNLEFKAGPLTVNFRVLLEPKGFLRIIVFVSSQLLLLAAIAVATRTAVNVQARYGLCFRVGEFKDTPISIFSALYVISYRWQDS